MRNGEFKVDIKSGVVVFCQSSHGQMFYTSTKVSGGDNFNIGIGQLIAMKKNEIKIRKNDIESMKVLVDSIDYELNHGVFGLPGINRKLICKFKQEVHEKISASRNHIRELNKDLKEIYNGKYPVPGEILDGTKIYDTVNGSMTLVKNPYNNSAVNEI